MATANYIVGTHYGFGRHLVFVKSVEAVAIVSLSLDY